MALLEPSALHANRTRRSLTDSDGHGSHYATRMFARSKAVQCGLQLLREDSASMMRPGILRSGTDHRTATWNDRQQAMLATTGSHGGSPQHRSAQHLAELQAYESPGDPARLLQASRHLFEDIKAQLAACHGNEKAHLLRSHRSAPELSESASAERQERGDRHAYLKKVNMEAQDRAHENIVEKMLVARGESSQREIQQLMQQIPMSVWNGNKVVHVQALERVRKPRSYYLDRSPPGGSQTLRNVSSGVLSRGPTSPLHEDLPQTDFIMRNQSSDALANFRLSHREKASQRWHDRYEQRSLRASKSRGDLEMFMQVEKTDPKVAKAHMRLAEVALGSRTLPLQPATMAQIHWLTSAAVLRFASALKVAFQKQKEQKERFGKRLGMEATWRAKKVVERMKRRKEARRRFSVAGRVMLLASRLLKGHREREAAAKLMRECLWHMLRTAEEKATLERYREFVKLIQKSSRRLLTRRQKIISKLRDIWDATEKRLRLKNSPDLPATIPSAEKDIALRMLLEGQAARKQRKVLAILADTVETTMKAEVNAWWFPRKEDMESLVLKVGAECRKKYGDSPVVHEQPNVVSSNSRRTVTYEFSDDLEQLEAGAAAVDISSCRASAGRRGSVARRGSAS